jgi:hypothetical protein
MYIQIKEVVATIAGPARPFPHVVVPNTSHSDMKWTKATIYVQKANSYMGLVWMLYAAYKRTMAVIAVHVPKVRADKGVTGEALGTVLAGMPAGSFVELVVAETLEPGYTFCVGPSER